MANWDVVVIGGGAAGLSAAAAAAGKGLSCVVIDRMGGGGTLMNLGILEDFEDGLAGPDLAARLLEAAVTAGAELEIAEVTGLAPEGTGWRISTEDGVHEAGAVILAVGLAPGVLGVEGEIDYENRGLSHCAVCDGPLYAGQPVIVAGADRWAVAEVRELVAIASQVTLVTQGATPPAVPDDCGVLLGRIVGLEGAPGLEAVTVETLVPGAGGAERQRIPTEVVFVQCGRRPALDFVPQTLPRGPDGRLVTNDALECGPNLFAAGDARAGADRTVACAIEEGHRTAAGVRAMGGGPIGKTAK